MQVKQGTVNPLVFSICGGMGRECQAFYTRLSELPAEKGDIHKSEWCTGLYQSYVTRC